MCTVTYLPYRAGFILTHNRDEAPTRSPQAISREAIGADRLLFPRDTKAGGAWIGTARSGKTACLLNGAFLKHKHAPPYRRSRGLMLLDFFQWPESEAFFRDYDLQDIEPFTLLFFRIGSVQEFRWDGAQRHLKMLPPNQAHFWCSATLYPPDMQEKRETVFRDWLLHLQANDPDRATDAAGRASIQRLHRRGSVGDPENDYIMNRGGRVRTVSISQVLHDGKTARMWYYDLLEGHRDQRQLTIQNAGTEFYNNDLVGGF